MHLYFLSPRLLVQLTTACQQLPTACSAMPTMHSENVDGLNSDRIPKPDAVRDCASNRSGVMVDLVDAVLQC